MGLKITKNFKIIIPLGSLMIFLLTLFLLLSQISIPKRIEKKAEFDFYGKRINFIKIFGQKNFKETARDTITANKIYHASGVLVDKSTKPNKIYVIDTGNNRILGFKSLGTCSQNPSVSCTNDTDCQPNFGSCQINTSKEADLIFGQPDSSSGTCNGDNNLGVFKNPDATTLCFFPFPGPIPNGGNLAEFWLRINFDVDQQGNLYIPDISNNRILKYNQPFSEDKSGGKGDNIADFVWGQPDFSSNQPGTGPENLNLTPVNNNNVSSRGVSVDNSGNVWVADTFNGRVLRFPPDSKTANLVLGQRDFNSKDLSICGNLTQPSDNLDKMCNPTLARVHPQTGELYVLDEYHNDLSGKGRTFQTRILVFSPPFTNGKPASRVIVPQQPAPLEDYWHDKGYHFQSTGFVFNTYKEGSYQNGELWVNELETNRTLLLDNQGNILQVIGPSDVTHRGCNYGLYDRQRCGQKLGSIFENFNLCWPGGQIGLDDANNIYLADEAFHRISRFSLPYYQDSQGCPPLANGGLFEGTSPNSVSGYHFAESFGVFTFQNQLVVKDRERYLVWNEYLNKPPMGSKADIIIGQENEFTRVLNSFQLGARASHTIDDKNRLWTINAHGKIIIFQLPFREGDQPLANFVKLYWEDDRTEIDYQARESAGLAFDKIHKQLWLADTQNNRLLRIKNYDKFPEENLLVDMVIGQPHKQSICCNQKPPQSTPPYCPWSWMADYPPQANTLCLPVFIKFDNYGNLYVVENTYECHGNDRITVFMAEDIQQAINQHKMFPNLEAKKVFVASSLNETGNCDGHKINEPWSPISLAFDSHNQMVVANDGAYGDPSTRHLHQLWFYHDPLRKDSSGNFIQGQLPDAFIDLPMGAPGEIWFDENDNLIVQDHTWSRVWLINLNQDPIWLNYINGATPPFPSFTPTPKPTSTPSLTPTPKPLPSITPSPLPTPFLTPIITVVDFRVKFKDITSPLVSKKYFDLLFVNAYQPKFQYKFNQIEFNHLQNGVFSGQIINLQPGTYNVYLKTEGFLELKIKNVTIEQGNNLLDWTFSPLIGGDIFQDGKINNLDYLIFLIPSLNQRLFLDLNLDRKVDNLDLNILIQNYGKISI